jgi:hypothetical protein
MFIPIGRHCSSSMDFNVYIQWFFNLYPQWLSLFISNGFSGLFFHVVGEGVVNLSRKAENITDKENYIDFRLRLLGEPGDSRRHFVRTTFVRLF